MAHDDDKPEDKDDPWAGLEEDGLPDLNGDFSFSFDDEPAAEAVADAFAEIGAEQAEEPAAIDDEFDESGDLPTVLAFSELTTDEPADAGSDLADDAEMFAEMPADDDGWDMEAGGEAESPAADGAAIDAWLTDDAAAAASSVFPFDVMNGLQPKAAELADAASSESRVEIGTGASGIISPSSIESMADLDAQAASDLEAGMTSDLDAEMDAAMDADAMESLTAEMIEAGIAGDEPEDAPDPFAAFAGDAAAEPDAEVLAFVAEPSAFDEAIEEGDDLADHDAAADAFGMAAAAAAAGHAVPAGTAKPRAASAKRAAADRRKKPSIVGQLLGVVAGGALAIPITLAILVWGFGRDPFGLTPLVPESLSFLVPAKFRPGGLGGDAIDRAGASSLDAIVVDPPSADDPAAEPMAAADPPPDTDLADAEPSSEPEPAEPTDLAVAAPLPAAGLDESGDDPLMDLLNEEDETDRAAAAGVAAVASLPASPPEPAFPPEPPAPPEPEPLDLDDLDAALAVAAARLEKVTAIDDPSDPARRLLLAEWYRDLAGYAQELVNLEALAIETGRPFEPAGERAMGVHAALAEHPELLAELAVLTHAWVSYTKRASDGLIVPATFVEARRVGPYWRSRIMLSDSGQPAPELVVLSRAEPVVSPGDAVLVTGLILDDDVIWAADLRRAEVADEVVPGL